MPLPFLTRHIRAVLIALCNRLSARSTDFHVAIGFWSAHERPTLGLPESMDHETLKAKLSVR
jgi:hypothetical protein